MITRLYRTLAYLTIGLHALIGLVALGGALFSLINPWLAVVHVPLAVWVIAAHWMGWTCPLTPVENYFWRAAGSDGYQGTFLGRYVLPAIETSHASRRRARSISVSTALINIALYTAVIISYAGQERFRPKPLSDAHNSDMRL